MRRFVLAAVTAALVLAPAGLVTTEATAATGTTHAVAANWPVVKQGARGERVRAIQLLLRQQGGRGIIVDGTFGNDTAAAVKPVQRPKRLGGRRPCGPRSIPTLG